MHEDTLTSENGIQFIRPVAPETNVRRAGSDVRPGEVILQQGTQLRGPQWALLAALGIAEATVTRRPRVGLIITGEELIAAGDARQPGQIFESNSYALRALVEEAGADLVIMQKAGDTQAGFEEALHQAARACDVVITTGGVSAGDFDPVRDVLLGKSTVHFWKVAMKPGKPVLFASWQDVPVFGLPGNPGSMLVTFEEFVRPALLKMGGRRELLRPLIEVEVATALSSPAGLTEFVHAHVSWRSGEKRPLAQVSPLRHSGRLATSAAANALLEVPAGVTFVPRGEPLLARLLYCRV
jgi:molybdopterin molybdotransferase